MHTYIYKFTRRGVKARKTTQNNAAAAAEATTTTTQRVIGLVS